MAIFHSVRFCAWSRSVFRDLKSIPTLSRSTLSLLPLNNYMSVFLHHASITASLWTDKKIFLWQNYFCCPPSFPAFQLTLSVPLSFHHLLKIKRKILSYLFNEKYGLKLGEFNNTTGTERVNLCFLKTAYCIHSMYIFSYVLFNSQVYETFQKHAF